MKNAKKNISAGTGKILREIEDIELEIETLIVAKKRKLFDLQNLVSKHIADENPNVNDVCKRVSLSS